MKCIVCGKVVDHDIWAEEFEEILEQVDTCGVESLKEYEQVAYEGKVCSYECMDKLEYAKDIAQAENSLPGYWYLRSIANS